MSVNVGSAIAYLDLDTSKFQSGLKTAMSSLKDVNTTTSTTTDKFNALGGGIASLGASISIVSVPLLGLGAASIKTAADFEAGMSKVSALSGITGQDLQELTDLAKEMGSTTKFSATEASEALQYMSLAGWDADQMSGALEHTLKLAGAAGMDLALATDIVTDTMSMYGLEADKAKEMTDMLAYTQANSNTDVQQLGEALKYCGASANAMGYDIADTSALLGTFADQGLKGSSAGTTLNAMFRDMKNSAEKGAIAIGKKKVAIVDANGSYRDMTDILADVEKATEGMTMAERDSALMNVFGTQALKGVNMALEAGSGKIKTFEEGIRNSKDAAGDMYDVMQNNLNGSIDNMKSAFEGVLITIGERLIPIFKSVVEKVTDMLTWFNNLSPGVQNVIIAIGGFIAILGPLLLLIGGLIIFCANVAAAVGVLSGAFAAGGAVATFFAGAIALITGPVGLVIGAIVALVAAGYLLITNWEEISAFASRVWDNIVNAIDTVIGWICEKLGVDWELVKTNITQIWSDIKTNISECLSGIWNVITETWNSIFGTISEALGKIKAVIDEGWQFIKTNVFEAIGNAIDALLAGDWEGFKNIISTAMENIRNKIKEMWEKIKNIISDTMASIKAKIDEAWQNIKNLVSNCIDNIKISIKTGWDNMKNTVNTGMENIKKIASTIWEGIKTDIKAKVDGIWNNIKDAFNGMVKSITDSLNKAKQIASDMWEGIKSIFKNPIKAVVNIFKKEKMIDGPPPKNNIETFKDEDNDLVNTVFDYSKSRDILRSDKYAIENAVNNSFKEIKIKLDEKTKTADKNQTVNINLNVDKVINNDDRDIEQLASELAFYIKRKQLI